MIDVRAPIEFQAGALPFATNLPLMADDERHQVGICYKEQGQKEAIALGHELVCGAIKAARVVLCPRRFALSVKPAVVDRCRY